MDWYLTWQDGVALAIAVVGLGTAWWLHRRFARPDGCDRCPMLREPKQPTVSRGPHNPGDA